jgi:hypothetical protein
MAEIVGGLFGVTPEALMAQREAALAQQATNFAQLSPMQSAQAGFYTAGNRLAGAAGGLLGAQDPEMAKAAALQGILKQADTTSPEGLATLARTLAGQGFGQQALQVSQQAQGMMKTQSEISKNMRERAAADPFQKLLERGVYTTDSLKKYQTSGDVGDLDLKTSDAKTQVVDTADGQLLINSSTGAIIANVGKKPVKPSIGSDIAAGLSPIMGAIAKGQATKSAEAGGTAVGKDVAAIQGKYTALNSVDDALNVVKKGIYAGGYGPLEEGLAKYSKGVLADKQRLVNTEEFRAYIGDVVIPRLTEFGGNDSVEELKYLKSVMAGETTMESKSIERILTKAKTKIEAGIKRTQKQQEAIGTGQQLPTGPVTGRAQQRTTRSGVVYTVEGE